MSDLRKAIAAAIFDPGATEGFKANRTLTEWQADAVMRVLERGPIIFGWDLAAGDDLTVASFFDGEQWTHEQVDRAKLLRGELGTITGFTITETKKR